MNHSRKTKAQLIQELEVLQQHNAVLEQAATQPALFSDVWWASTDRLRAALEFLPMPVGIATAGGDILYFNQQFTKVYGYTREEVPTVEAWMRTAYPDAAMREKVLTVWNEDVAEAVHSGDATPAREYPVMCRDGTQRSVEIVMRAVGDLWMTFFNDVTARRQAEEEIHRSRSMLMHILNSVPQAVFWKDRSSVYLGCNEVFARAAGLPNAAAVVGKTDFDLPWPRSEADAYRADDVEVVERNQIMRHIVEPLQQADGTRLWVDTTKIPLTDETGHIYGVLGVYDDITERKLTNEALLESQRRLNKAQEIAHVGDWEIDLATKTLTASEEAFRIYGIAHESPILPLELAQACAFTEDRPRMDTALLRLITQAGGYDEEFRIHRADDGQLRYIHSRAELHLDANGQPFRVQGILQDITAQKLAEVALRASEEQYRVLVDNINIGVFKSTLAGRFLLVNQTVTTLTGYTVAELLTQPTRDLYVDSADRDHMLAVLLEQGAIKGMEFRSVKKDGTHYWAELSGVLLRNDTGQPEFILGFVQDVTERHRLTEAVQRSEQRFRALVEHSADAVTLISADGKILYEGPTVARLTGYSAEARAWHNAMANVFPEDLPIVHAVLSRVMAQPGYSETAQFRSLRKDGSIWWTEGTATNLLHEPAVKAIVVNYRDITERKQAEDAEHDQRALAEALRDIATALSMVHEPEEIFDVVVSQTDRIVPYAALRILLLEADGQVRVARQHITIERNLNTGAEHFNPQVGAGWQQVLDSGLVAVQTEVDALADWLGPAHVTWASACAIAPLKIRSTVIGFIQVLTALPDSYTALQVERLQALSERIGPAIENVQLYATIRAYAADLERRVSERTRELSEANARLIELDQLKDQFVARISHELRTPLANIGLYAELLRSGKPEKRAHYEQTLRQQAMLLQEHVEHLLAVSRLSLGKVDLSFVELNVNAMLRALVSDRTAQALSQQLTLRTVLEPDLPPVVVDPAMLEQALDNVLANAMNYTPLGGTIWLRTGRHTTDSGDWVTIEIRDSGPGIAAEDLPHIFEPFYRGAVTHDYKVPGMGVGLFIARRAIEKLDGQLTVTSRAGEGAVFTLWLNLSV